MVMQFDQFVRELDTAVRALGVVDGPDASKTDSVSWFTRGRRADVALVPPLNVSVALQGPSGPASTTWYPIDAVLVPLVSRRIAAYLSEA
jgi:hypothetical protein